MIETLWRWRAWVMALGVTALAALLRLGELGHPHRLVFDEVHYVPGSYSLLRYGFEAEWEGDKQVFAEGDYSGLDTERGDYIVHPMVGKLMIAAGMRVGGVNSFGWRLAGTVAGILMVLIVALLMRRIMRSTLWGGVAGLLLAVDGNHIVMSRTAILDIFLAFWVLVGFALLWLDRWRAQRIYAAYPPDSTSPWGPRVGIRWWRLAAIVSFGLATGVKWSGAYFAAAFLVMSVVWDAVDRRRAGYARWLPAAFLRNAVPGGVSAIVLLPAVYVAQWANWFLTDGSYYRRWAENHPGEGVQWLPAPLRSLWEYHVSMWDFHSTLETSHNWEAHPNGWILQFRPTLFYFERLDGLQCAGDDCIESIMSVGNPLIWWGSVVALCYTLWRLNVRRDALGVVFALGIAAGWVPWIPYAYRTIFTFYSVAMVAFVVMLVTWALQRFSQPDHLGGRFQRWKGMAVGFYLVAVLAVSAFFYPVWTGQAIPEWYRTGHVWLPTW